MNKNSVHFQHGESLVSFLKRLGTDEPCHSALSDIRWPNGFRCPECGGKESCCLSERQ